MTNNHDRVDVVLDVYAEPDTYRVVMVGVFEPGQKIPVKPEGATRNVIQTFAGVATNVRAFAMNRA